MAAMRKDRNATKVSFILLLFFLPLLFSSCFLVLASSYVLSTPKVLTFRNKVTMIDFLEAISATQPRITAEMIQFYSDFREQNTLQSI